MILGIMQPYIFPYIGYFQLIQSVDKFVFYDDVNFIKQGWINRNRILLNCNDYVFSIPLKNASSFNTINNTEINNALYPTWKEKFIKTLNQSYSKAPNYKIIIELICNVLNSSSITIGTLAINSILQVCQYLNIEKVVELSSTIYSNSELKSAARVIDICKREGASKYINPIGGQELYSQEFFKDFNIKLNFIKSKSIVYKQYNCNFVPWLSIIDLLMFLSKDEIAVFLTEYELI